MYTPDFELVPGMKEFRTQMGITIPLQATGKIFPLSGGPDHHDFFHKEMLCFQVRAGTKRRSAHVYVSVTGFDLVQESRNLWFFRGFAAGRCAQGHRCDYPLDGQPQCGHYVEGLWSWSGAKTPAISRQIILSESMARNVFS